MFDRASILSFLITVPLENGKILYIYIHILYRFIIMRTKYIGYESAEYQL